VRPRLMQNERDEKETSEGRSGKTCSLYPSYRSECHSGFLEQPIDRPYECSKRVAKHCNYAHLSCRKLNGSSCRTRPRAAYIFVIFIPSLAPRGAFA
jgi:hypothetical protein